MDCSGLLQVGEQCAGGGVGLVAGLVRGNSAKDLLLHLRADCRTSGNVRVVCGAGKAIVTQPCSGQRQDGSQPHFCLPGQDGLQGRHVSMGHCTGVRVVGADVREWTAVC